METKETKETVATIVNTETITLDTFITDKDISAHQITQTLNAIRMQQLCHYIMAFLAIVKLACVLL